MRSKEFSISFWIRLADNPGWGNKESKIDFSSALPRANGTEITFKKEGKGLKIDVLYPDGIYQKLDQEDISKYLGKDTSVAIVSNPNNIELFLNGKSAKRVKHLK